MGFSSFGNNSSVTGSFVVSGSVVLNEGGREDANFRVESDDRAFSLYVDSANDRVGIGCFVAPLHNVEIHHEGADGDEGIMIIRYDGAVYTDNILGGIGFDSADGNRPSRTNEASAYIAGYASQNHSTTEKGGYLVLGTAPDDQDDDTASSERVRITSAGDVGIGTSSPTEQLQVMGTARILKNNNAAGAKAKFILAKSKGTEASPTVIASGNTIGAIEFNAYDGDEFLTAAEVYAKVDNTPGDGDMPGSLHLATTADGSDGTTDRLVIDSKGNVRIGTDANSVSMDGTALGVIAIHDGIEPAAVMTNSVQLYSRSGELKVIDAAGNATILSPHPDGTPEWIYYSKNLKTGKTVKIHMEKLMKKLNDLLGEDLYEEWIEDIT